MENMESNYSDEFSAELQRHINCLFGKFPLHENQRQFLAFHDDHTNEISNLLQQFAKTSGVKSAVVLARQKIIYDHLHPDLVKLALGIFLTHNPEARNLYVLPPSLQLHNKFVNMFPLSNPVTADTFKGVNLLSYFREDYGLNDHHFHWHLLFPYTGITNNGKTFHRVIERQGELFLYMHTQMIARYNAELLSWDQNLLHAWGYYDILTVGYNPVPGLRDKYGARPPFQGWYENHNPNLENSPNLTFNKAFPPRTTMVKWKDNVIQAINQGYFITKKKDGSLGRLYLTPEDATNWVGIVLEAENRPLQEVKPGSHEFIDRDRYGSIHNYGHDKFAEIGYHDYTSSRNLMGVMMSSFSSPRDPAFWLWHRHIDDFRQMTVNKYSHNLNNSKPNGVVITDLKILPYNKNSKTPMRGITTFLESPQLHLNEANAKLNHEPYEWQITVKSINNKRVNNSNPITFTVRLFITPAALVEDQRYWIEMDKFTYNLTSVETTIIRRDIDSSVARKVYVVEKHLKKQQNVAFCGWPQRMMLPVGKPDGAPYVAFAMLTNDTILKVSTRNSYVHAPLSCKQVDISII